MILLTLSRGKGEETVRLQLPASPAEIGETFAFLDRISLDTTATAILDVSSNVPVLYRCLYDVDVEDSEQFQKLQKLAERTEALSPAKAAIFSGALDAECVWNLEGALTVADRLDEYMLVNNVSSDSELGIYLVNKGITPFPDRFKPYINYARVGAEYNEVQARELIDCLREIAPYVVIDCGSYIANDILSAVALMEADSVLRLANADLKSISYLSSQLPLLRDAKWDTDKQYKTASNVKSQQAGDHMSQALGTVAFTLPHSAELEGQYLAGNLLADLSMKDSRVFRKEIEKIAREVFGC